QSKLIEDLLDVSRSISGKLRIEPELVDIASVIDAAVEEMVPDATQRGVAIEADLDRSLGPVSGDPARLRQIIGNLLSNAIKFTPPDGHVSVRLERDPAGVRITVRDDGAGIAPEFLPHVFTPFVQESMSPSGGLGLGLAIVRQLVELHGGTVIAESAG